MINSYFYLKVDSKFPWLFVNVPLAYFLYAFLNFLLCAREFSTKWLIMHLRFELCKNWQVLPKDSGKVACSLWKHKPSRRRLEASDHKENITQSTYLTYRESKHRSAKSLSQNCKLVVAEAKLNARSS